MKDVPDTLPEPPDTEGPDDGGRQAGLRVRFQTIPKPMRNCTSAKTLLLTTGL